VKSEIDDLGKIVQQYNDFYNNSLPLCLKSPKCVDPPIEPSLVEKQIKEFDDKVKKVLADGEKRVKDAEKKAKDEEKKLQEEKKKQEEESAKASVPNPNGDNMQVDS